jgi:hypothetical protein
MLKCEALSRLYKTRLWPILYGNLEKYMRCLEEYLEGEKYSDIKHEHVANQIYTMFDIRRAHASSAGNFSPHCIAICIAGAIYPDR